MAPVPRRAFRLWLTPTPWQRPGQRDLNVRRGRLAAAPFSEPRCRDVSLVVVALAVVVGLGRLDDPDDDAGVTGVREAADIAADIDLAMRVLADTADGQRDAAAREHDQLAGRAKATAGARVDAERAAVVVRTAGELEEQREVREDVLAAQRRDCLAVVDIPADDGMAFVVGVVLGNRIAERTRSGAAVTRPLGTIGARVGKAVVGHTAVDVEEQGAFLAVPARVATLRDEVHLRDVVLADVSDIEIDGLPVERETIRVPVAEGIDFRHRAGRAHERI